MNPTEALTLLAAALEPMNAGRLSRADYIRIQQALETLSKVVNPPKQEDKA